jgi:hypothetical protein
VAIGPGYPRRREVIARGDSLAVLSLEMRVMALEDVFDWEQVSAVSPMRSVPHEAG